VSFIHSVFAEKETPLFAYQRIGVTIYYCFSMVAFVTRLPAGPSTRGAGGVFFTRPAAQFPSTRGAGGVFFIRSAAHVPSTKKHNSFNRKLNKKPTERTNTPPNPSLRGELISVTLNKKYKVPVRSVPLYERGRGCVFFPSRHSVPLYERG